MAAVEAIPVTSSEKTSGTMVMRSASSQSAPIGSAMAMDRGSQPGLMPDSQMPMASPATSDNRILVEEESRISQLPV